MTFKNTNKRDANEPAIVAVFNECGCKWIQLKPGQGADGILLAPCGVHVVEIKNPAYGCELTEAEAALKAEMEALGLVYHVIFFEGQARELAEGKA